jgi:sortase A
LQRAPNSYGAHGARTSRDGAGANAMKARRVIGGVLVCAGFIHVGYALTCIGLWRAPSESFARAEEINRLLTESDVSGSREHSSRLSIPRLSFTTDFGETKADTRLLFGPGHMTWSAYPGGIGNSIVVGHRDTQFRVLKRVRLGDEIILAVNAQQFKYRVFRIYVSRPGNEIRSFIRPGRYLTLVTCYPFSYVGPAPNRFVMTAEME